MNRMILTFVALFLTAIFAVMELIFASAAAMRSPGDDSHRTLTDRIIDLFCRDEERYITTMLVGGNIALVLYAVAALCAFYPLLAPAMPYAWLAVVTVIVAAVVLLYAAVEAMCMLFTGINPRLMMHIVAPVSMLFYVLLYPISWLIMLLSQGWMRLTRVAPCPRRMEFMLSKVELDAFIQDTLENAPRDSDTDAEMKMLHNALDFGNVTVRDCMVPRTEIIAVDIEQARDTDLEQLFVSTGKSKVVVYRDNIDNVLGFYHVAELFHGGDWRRQVHTILFVPQSKPANKLMRLFMQQKKSIAIVVDEFGGTAGLVTLEDLVEEIFGEIEDEHDRTDIIARRVANDEYEFSGRMEIAAINEQYDLDLPQSDDYLTLAGYILHHYQTLPAMGETVTIGPLAFTIKRRRANRIELVRVKIAPK